MKVILTGTTGYVGSEILKQCLANKAISQITVLSRRELPTSTTGNPKLKVIIHKDFLSYAPSLLDELSGSVGCLWALGGKATDFKDVETARTVQVDYAEAAAKAFAAALGPKLGDSRKFRFVFCSGQGAERDQKKALWFMKDTRQIKGQAENGILAVEKQHASVFDVFVVRPGGILNNRGLVSSAVMKLAPFVQVDQVAKVMVDLCLNGEERKILQNADIVGKATTLASS